MFAINHAATALVLKRRFPEVSLVWLLLSVQAVEILWVLLHFLGIERTTTEAAVHTVRDIHLLHMPWSHSLATSALFALVAWLLIGRVLNRRAAAAAITMGVGSHIVLDLLTHTRDIPIAPFLAEPKIGLGLYAIPPLAFLIETLYGLACWRIFRGGKPLLLAILLFNLANATLFFEALRGPEELLAGRPLWLAGAVAIQILVTLTLVGFLAYTRERRGVPAG